MRALGVTGSYGPRHRAPALALQALDAHAARVAFAGTSPHPETGLLYNPARPDDGQQMRRLLALGRLFLALHPEVPLHTHRECEQIRHRSALVLADHARSLAERLTVVQDRIEADYAASVWAPSIRRNRSPSCGTRARPVPAALHPYLAAGPGEPVQGRSRHAPAGRHATHGHTPLALSQATRVMAACAAP